MEIIRCSQEQSLHIRTRAVLAKEVMGEYLRPARVEVGMIMGNDQYACRQMTYSGLPAMMTSW
jgi:hypothetical protein